MTHPLDDQFRFTRSEWLRGLKGVSEEDGSRHFGPMNCISWTVGHLAWHDRREKYSSMKTLNVTDCKKWRQWLREHYKTEKEIWLVYYKKGSGKPRIEYNDAVEEALCYGWIDSIIRTIDEESFAQRFSPRKPGSRYSPANKERLRNLLKKKKVIKEVRDTLGDLTKEELVIPEDILAEIKANTQAWKNFQNFSDAYKRIRIGFIEGARNRPAEFKKRLAYFIRMTEQNKQFGFGGIEKQY